MISEIRSLWSYLCKPVGDWNIERPRTPRIKNGNYFWYIKLETKWIKLWYWIKYIYIYIYGYTLDVMLLCLWRFDPTPVHGLPSLGFTFTLTDTPRPVGLLWTSDQHDAENSTRQRSTHTTDSHPCTSAGFEPANPGSERLQTRALDGLGSAEVNVINVTYIWIVDRVNWKVCYVSVTTSRDNHFY